MTLVTLSPLLLYSWPESRLRWQYSAGQSISPCRPLLLIVIIKVCPLPTITMTDMISLFSTLRLCDWQTLKIMCMKPQLMHWSWCPLAIESFNTPILATYWCQSVIGRPELPIFLTNHIVGCSHAVAWLLLAYVCRSVYFCCHFIPLYFPQPWLHPHRSIASYVLIQMWSTPSQWMSALPPKHLPPVCLCSMGSRPLGPNPQSLLLKMDSMFSSRYNDHGSIFSTGPGDMLTAPNHQWENAAIESIIASHAFPR